MISSEYNKIDSPEIVQSILDYVKEHVFEPDAIDISRFHIQRRRLRDEEASKTARFVVEYNIQNEDVRNAMADLTLDEYSTTSVKSGCNDAYVFGIHMPEIIDENPEIYLKFQTNDGIIIVTIHEADRPMKYPYRRNVS